MRASLAVAEVMRDPVHLGLERRIISGGFPDRRLFSRPNLEVEAFHRQLYDFVLAPRDPGRSASSRTRWTVVGLRL